MTRYNQTAALIPLHFSSARPSTPPRPYRAMAPVADTEVGLGKEPEITFSTCLGAPFMVHHPSTYADLLKRRVLRYGVNCWLVNTGWNGGPYGIGKRISIAYTRALLNAALSGKLLNVEYYTDPVFGFRRCNLARKCSARTHSRGSSCRTCGSSRSIKRPGKRDAVCADQSTK